MDCKNEFSHLKELYLKNKFCLEGLTPLNIVEVFRN